MALTQRGLRRGLDLVWPLLVAVAWAAQGISALTAEGAMSARLLFVWVAFALAGLGSGVLFAALGLRHAERIGRVPGVAQPNGVRPLDFMLMGLVFMSFGMSPVYGGSAGTWDQASLVFWTLAGGLLVGAALGMQRAAGS